MLRVQIATRTDVLNGKTFGDAGAYERITGRVYFSLPVANPHNQRIVDLGNAVNLKNGEVEFSSDFIAIRPKDAQQGQWLDAAGGSQPRAMHALLPWWTAATGMSRMTRRRVAAAQRLHLCKPGVAVGRGRSRRLTIFCADREGKWEDHHRLAARRPDAVEGDGGDSAWAFDTGQYRGNRIPGGSAR